MHLDERGEPVWTDGDVVRIRFKRKRTADLSDEYQYSRKGGYWPGVSGGWSDLSDEEMTAAWHENRAKVMEMFAATQTSNTAWPNQETVPFADLYEEKRPGFWAVYDASTRNPLVTTFEHELDARRWADDPVRAYNPMLRIRFFDFSD